MTIETMLDAMSLEDQVHILSGASFWSVEGAGLGTLRVTDGPNGARGGGSLVGGVKSAAFPVGIAIGATWNPELAQKIGQAIAQEVKSKGAHVSLAPTVNIQRSVTNGRNFECYSEDPILTAALAVGYVKGLQGEGISATIKHFAGNESEIERTTMSSDIDERSLREVYLIPFEAAVKEAGTWGIMSSYNRLNGTYTAESEWLLTKVLREDWGYDGIVMSDWFGSRTTAPTVNAGLDLEMPGPTRDRGAKLVQAVKDGLVSRETVRERAANMLRLMARVGSLTDHRAHVEVADDRPEHRALIRRAGAEGAVLLKNDGLLPLSEQRIAVIGPNGAVAQIMGGGSAQLNPHYAVSPLEGLRARGLDVTHAAGCTNHRFEPLLQGVFTAEMYSDRSFGNLAATVPMDSLMAFWFPPMPGGVDPVNFSARIRGTVTTEAGLHRLGVYAAGFAKVFLDGNLIADASEGKWTKGRTFFEEGCDEVVGEVNLTAGAHEILVEFVSKPSDNLAFAAMSVGLGRPMGDAEIAEAARIAADAECAVVFVGRSGEWDTEGSDLQTIRLPGRQDELVAAVLKANANTVIVLQTGGPVEMPWLPQARAVLQAWYPGQEAGNAIADVLYGAEPSGRLAQTFPKLWSHNPTHSQDQEIYPGLNGHVRYEEGVFIGYRHYDKQGIDPLFPFGHGLSYTSFDLSDTVVAAGNGRASVTTTVTNTGARRGATVVQVYVGDPQASVPRPAKELKSFAKLWLDPGESRRITLDLAPRAFAFWQDGWVVEAGEFTVQTGFSAADLRHTATITMGASRLPV
ncbi:glycoside hydrolase family 3 C-terminal domain-containing protein [Rhodobacter sp. KR11]|uniref:beta-glucosidase n=1 Tax=Rhodobacter sp. KR11 TaxID=2974588 RepID=UPI002222F1E1|nr:glycoside hydrolase family 3 C-terminal domain-containing protein [Rhodobacter sp. KR11]MCW1919030.1 glycoside hydrolase family 3 C-terminal domain-containing protein [Rhodobacter sp. KR11]